MIVALLCVLVSLQTAIPFLIGTKYDIFATSPPEDQEEVTKQVFFFLI